MKTDRSLQPMPWGGLGAALLFIGLGLLLSHQASGAAPAAPAAPADIDRITGACGSPNPYFVTSRFAGELKSAKQGLSSAIFAFRDTPGDDPTTQITLATQADVGATYGLAYDAGRRQVYAAAYHKRGAPFGPGGPGAIYHIDLASGAVAPWVTLEAGPDRHDLRVRDDEPALVWVGRTSLGDIDLDEDGSSLFVANLYDAKIYRLAVPDGTVLAAFRHGAFSESWARNARLFGLGYRDGWLYHGVMDTAGTSWGVDNPVGYIYRSRADGSDMREVASFEITPQLGSTRGHPVYAAALWRISDLEFRPGGNLIVGLRDWQLDAPASAYSHYYGSGAILPTEADGDRWRVSVGAGYYDETFGISAYGYGSASGGLAAVPGLDQVVSNGHGLFVYGSGNPTYELTGLAMWFDNDKGTRQRLEHLVRFGPLGTLATPSGLGDVEALCDRYQPIDPNLVATETREAAVIATATADARSTQVLATHTAAAATVVRRMTAIAETATIAAATGTIQPPTPAGTPAILATLTAVGPELTALAPTRDALATAAATAATVPPAVATAAAEGYRRITESCGSDNPFLAITCLVPALNIAGGQHPSGVLDNSPAIVAFNDTAAERPADHIELARELPLGAVHGLAYDWRRGQLYASAYHKRLARFGPGGPGAIYRLDLASGAVGPWVVVNAGPDTHRLTSGVDEPAATGVGTLGIGDIELDEAGTMLFAVNLSDRLIYRFSVPDGAFLSAFPNGAALEPWAASARPFGLGVRDGWLYHGVVDSGVTPAARWAPLAAYIYRSRPDGSDIEEVARFDLGYPRGGAAFGGAYTWQPWQDAPRPTGPMLTDIAFRPNGDPIVGLRNRNGDALFGVGDGDILPTLRLADRWFVWPDPEFYPDQIVHDESAWGSLAELPGLDVIVSVALDPWQANSGGALWYDNVSGAIARRETVYSYGATSPTFGKSAGLGDVEVLCPPWAPSPTATSTATDTATATSTPSTTPSTTPTATPRPRPIYLPVVLGETCKYRQVHAAVALVIDASTSMRRPTVDGREKLAAVQAAAHVFLTQMDFTPDAEGKHDQVAIVGFNDSAWIEQPLSAEATALGVAIDRLRDGVAQGTRLDLALDEGMVALEDPALIPGNTRVIVLLTDGLPNRVPTPTPTGNQEDTVMTVAQLAKARGLRIYTIGVGRPDGPDLVDRINADLLRAVASEPAMFYQTMDADELARIYTEIAYTIGCPPERLWGQRP